jgi:hypothetical protein
MRSSSLCRDREEKTDAHCTEFLSSGVSENTPRPGASASLSSNIVQDQPELASFNEMIRQQWYLP